MTEGCKCQGCGCRYKVDLLIPDELWTRIGMPANGSGLLCGICIMTRLEALDKYGVLMINDTTMET